jgi:hypothetical protein
MSSFPKEQYVLTLLNEVAAAASDLQRGFTADIVLAAHKAKDALSAPTTTAGHLSLVLSAARRHIQTIEKRVVALIIGDEPISQREMSHLVRIRLICTELLNILARALADLKLNPHGNKLRLSSFKGS